MINSLQDELGFALFHREHHKLIPIREAAYLLEEATALLSRLEQAKTILKGVSQQTTGPLRVACHPAASSFFVPNALTEFLSDKPDVHMTLRAMPPNTIKDLVASNQYDLGFNESPHRRGSTKSEDFELPCFCAMAATSPMASPCLSNEPSHRLTAQNNPWRCSSMDTPRRCKHVRLSRKRVRPCGNASNYKRL